jgi:hypothetical protein
MPREPRSIRQKSRERRRVKTCQDERRDTRRGGEARECVSQWDQETDAGLSTDVSRVHFPVLDAS